VNKNATHLSQALLAQMSRRAGGQCAAPLQSNAGARELGRCMEPFEREKEIRGMGHVKTGTIVLYKINRPVSLCKNTKFDFTRGDERW